MKKYIPLFTFAIVIFIQLIASNAKSQCNWRTQLFDGFEYLNACPYVIPGTVYTNIPQTYAVHSGARSLYLNFVNCTSGTGTCAGDTVFKRQITACPGMPLKISSFLTTTFSGPQCDVRILILDASNNVLVNTDTLIPSYSPAWSNYQSGTFTPTTTLINFVMITNVGGGNGNDLSMDDFLVEQCYPVIFGNDTTICNTQTVILNAGSGYNSYLWTTGATTQTIIASTSGGGASAIFYQVLVTDSNGCSFRDTVKVTFLVCSGINEFINGASISVYPNPASDYLILETTALATKGIYFVMSDINGREIKSILVQTDKQQILLEGVKSGMYFYQLIADDKTISRGNIVIR